jgi:hypothetical protein
MEHPPHHETISLREWFSDKLQVLEDKLDTIIRASDDDRRRLSKVEVAIAILQWGYALGAVIALWWVYERGKP